MKTAIRVDSSTVIGSGHLMRCLTLAERMRKEQNAEVHFISRDLEGNLHEKIKEAGFFLHVLPRHALDESLTGYAAWLTVSKEQDAKETLDCVTTQFQRLNWLIVDSYALDEVWEKMLRPYVGKIVVIDDLANRKHDCDALLDQNFYLDMEHRYDGLVPSVCKKFLGPQYALLREEFYEEKKHARERTGKVKNILVFYGGSDSTNETMKALRALVRMERKDIAVQVVVGGGNPHKNEIKTFCKRYPWMEYACQVNNMAERMNIADLSIGAGGTTTWERCFLGLPAIVTAVAENQEDGCLICASKGLFAYLGRWAEVDEEIIIKALQKAFLAKELQDMQQNCRLGQVAESSSLFFRLFGEEV